MVRDSAGVRIVESRAPAWSAGDGWQLAPRPSLVIGTALGEAPYLFHRVAGAVRLSDGSIVVADGSTRELRLFDGAGTFVTAAGGAGAGPGEFRDLGVLARFAGDSLLAFDRALRRAMVFAPDLALARVVVLPEVAGMGLPSVELALDDGTLVARSNVGGPAGERAGLWRDTLLVVAFEADTGSPAVVLRAPGDDRYTTTDAGSVQHHNHPLGRRPSLASDGARLFVNEGSHVSVDVVSRAGVLRERWRASVPLVPAGADARAELETAWKSQDPTPDWSREVDRILDALILPETLPAADRMLVDARGAVWLRPFHIAAADAAAWFILDGEEGYLGRVTLPGGLRPTDIGAEHVLGVALSPEGTEEIRLYTLTRS